MMSSLVACDATIVNGPDVVTRRTKDEAEEKKHSN